MRGSRSHRIRLVATAVAAVAALVATAPGAHAGSRTCTTRKPCSSSADTTPPTVAITSPASGATVAGTFAAAGTAADGIGVARVDVAVDGGSFLQATGTTSWSLAVDASGWAAGSHTLTARATDTSGNTATASSSVSVAAAPASGSDIRLADPAGSYGLSLIGRGAMAEAGTVSALLYADPWTSRRAVYFRDAATGANSYVTLPLDSLAGWANATYLLAGPAELWVWGGGGPVYLRHYQLSGSPVPTSATLLSSQSFGDTDSRRGALTRLASGAVVAVWNQQGQTGAQGLGIVYRSPAGALQTIYPLQFMPTSSSKQVIAQHPVDGSVWLFNDPDAFGQIGAAHFTEGPSGLRVDWTNAGYLTPTANGDFAPDPENADLALAPDPSTGTLVLAYQSAVRQMFSTAPVVTGSEVAIARIGPSGPTSFAMLPVFVERISALGLVVRPGETWVAYRPVDPVTLTFDKLYVNVLRGGAWGTPKLLGTLADPYGLVGFGISRPEFSAALNDGGLHFVTAG